MYESIYKALQKIRNKKDRAEAYDAICAYALYNTEPDLNSVSDAVAIAFELTRPVLDSARKKAENGKQGGSKTKANSKQKESKQEQPEREKEKEKENENEKEVEKENENEEEIEKENENENENEEEIEKESLLSLSAGGGDSARAREATESELASIGIKPGEFFGLTGDFVTCVRKTADALFEKYFPNNDPKPWDYRQVSRYCGASGRAELLDYAFEKAAIAGKLYDWRYIDGIMDMLLARGITTEMQARMWDEERPDLDILE